MHASVRERYLVLWYFGTLKVWTDALDCKRELERKAWMGLCV